MAFVGYNLSPWVEQPLAGVDGCEIQQNRTTVQKPWFLIRFPKVHTKQQPWFQSISRIRSRHAGYFGCEMDVELCLVALFYVNLQGSIARSALQFIRQGFEGRSYYSRIAFGDKLLDIVASKRVTSHSINGDGFNGDGAGDEMGTGQN